MRETQVMNEKRELEQKLKEKAKAGELKAVNGSSQSAENKKKRRWDQTSGNENNETPNKKLDDESKWHEATTPRNLSSMGKEMETPMHRAIWEPTPGHAEPGATTPPDLAVSLTPKIKPGATRRRWDETPKTERAGTETPHVSGWAETPKVERIDEETVIIAKQASIIKESKKRSRWDETPVGAQTPVGNMTPSFTPTASITPSHGGSMYGIDLSGPTPSGFKAMNLQTPIPSQMIPQTPEQIQAQRWEKEIDERNRPISDEELDSLFPPGYKIMPPPDGYVPIRTPARKLTATPTPMNNLGQTGFKMMATPDRQGIAALIPDYQPQGNLPLMKPDDLQYFNKLLDDVDEDTLPLEEQKERKIMKLLLKIKNGTPPMRKSALRQITDKAREFGAGPLFNQILPLLMSPSLEDQERHLLVKVIDRILYKLDDLVRPYVHKILVVIEPLLIDEDYYARVEGREIISNLAKAAGLATMISTMRPDIDNLDEYVRNTPARAFAVVASALGIPSLLPFLKAVCKSKKSWQARHTGIKIIQQIAILMGCAILPHLKALVDVIEHGLEDEQQKVRTITALALAALAEAATPYGIESFDSVLKPLWRGKLEFLLTFFFIKFQF